MRRCIGEKQKDDVLLHFPLSSVELGCNVKSFQCKMHELVVNERNHCYFRGNV